MLNAADIITVALAVVAASLALAVVLTRHIFRAAVYLMLVLVVTAGFYLLLGAEFLAGIQVLVYVGGIVVVMVFAVMLTSAVDLLETPPPIMRRLLGVLVSGGFFAASSAAILATPFPVGSAPALPVDTTSAIGEVLLSQGSAGYVLPFELISLLLLAAVIGGIVIARKLPVAKVASVPAKTVEAPPVMR